MSTGTPVARGVINLAADLEQFDPIHEARLLILLHATARREPVDGIMKLAKMDFLLRYPRVLERALTLVAERKPSATKVAARISEQTKDTVEGRMIRFRYGPWDRRYRKWLSIMLAKGLVLVWKEGRAVRVSLTDRGLQLAQAISLRPEFVDLADRADIVRFAVGDLSATRLKDLVYQIAPEIVGMKWGEAIRL
jgi:hypothetical protein